MLRRTGRIAIRRRPAHRFRRDATKRHDIASRMLGGSASDLSQDNTDVFPYAWCVDPVRTVVAPVS